MVGDVRAVGRNDLHPDHDQAETGVRRRIREQARLLFSQHTGVRRERRVLVLPRAPQASVATWELNDREAELIEPREPPRRRHRAVQLYGVEPAGRHERRRHRRSPARLAAHCEQRCPRTRAMAIERRAADP